MAAEKSGAEKVKLKKRGNNKKKGNAFENQMCKLLSLWWTEGKRDDVFQRTASSGGKATMRGKQGKGTENQYGDITASTSEGIPLIDQVSIELKKGYNKYNCQEAYDSKSGKTTMFYGFLFQAREAAIKNGSGSWLLIWKKAHKKTLVFLPLPVKRPTSWNHYRPCCCHVLDGFDTPILQLDWDTFVSIKPDVFIEQFCEMDN